MYDQCIAGPGRAGWMAAAALLPQLAQPFFLHPTPTPLTVRLPSPFPCLCISIEYMLKISPPFVLHTVLTLPLCFMIVVGFVAWVVDASCLGCG